MTETGLYLYAVARGLPEGAVDGQTGVHAGPLSRIDLGGLEAVVSPVDLAEFGEAGLRRNLEDLTWLETVARVHDSVVHAVAGHAPVAPMRLATVFLGEGSLRERLAEWSAPLHAALDRVQGCQEWSVKVFVEPGSGTPGPDAAPSGQMPEGAGPGASYLFRRRDQLAAREREQEEAARVGDSVHAELVRGVAASRRLPPQDRRLSGHQGTMVLNAAYLVADGETDRWRQVLEQLRERHPIARVEVNGPWPPYSFATLEEPV